MRIVIFLLVVCPSVSYAQIPRAALQHQRTLIQNARFVFGLNAPIAILAAQVHQESGWRTDAQSKYAGGLAQFTPSTADWISQKFPYELGENQPFNPAWALRALARYDKFLYDRQPNAATECDRWAFTLSGYNGGEGWVNRDKRLAAMNRKDIKRWWGHVELYSPRAAWAIKENRDYPRRILLQRQPSYLVWGLGVTCEVINGMAISTS